MSNEMISKNVFLGGSKCIGRLPDKVVTLIDELMEKREHFIIGDCHGMDLAFQTYLESKHYPHVTIYCSGEKCRFNVGDWPEKHICVPDGIEGYKFYRVKDYALMKDCDAALLVYETRALATRSYIYYLKRLGKPIFAFDLERDRFKIIDKREVTE